MCEKKWSLPAGTVVGLVDQQDMCVINDHLGQTHSPTNSCFAIVWKVGTDLRTEDGWTTRVKTVIPNGRVDHDIALLLYCKFNFVDLADPAISF